MYSLVYLVHPERVLETLKSGFLYPRKRFLYGYDIGTTLVTKKNLVYPGNSTYFFLSPKLLVEQKNVLSMGFFEDNNIFLDIKDFIKMVNRLSDERNSKEKEEYIGFSCRNEVVFFEKINLEQHLLGIYNKNNILPPGYSNYECFIA